MIHAIRKGKTKLGRNEDSLTSSVFQLLGYLPDDLFRRIICSSLRYNINEAALGRLAEVEFWPRWDGHGISEDRSTVEPDVLIRFDNIDINDITTKDNTKGNGKTSFTPI
jgi:hypothetical protein